MGGRAARVRAYMGAALVSRLSPARACALEALLEAERAGAYVRELLPAAIERIDLDARDGAFATRLALGVTATQGCLDELLDRFLDRPQRVALPVRWGLRIAAFELMYLAHAPHVAVSQGVELVRSRSRHAAGLANAVLRRVADARTGYFTEGDVALRKARAAGMPCWLAEEIERSLGSSLAEKLFAAQLEPAPLALHLAAAGADARSLDGAASLGPLPGSIVAASLHDAPVRDALASGGAVASDLHAQLVAAAGVSEGSCLEIGAGRGTKTYVMAALARRAHIARTHVAVDLYPGKGKANRGRLERAGLAAGVSFAAGDARDLDEVLRPLEGTGQRRCFDTVLVDAPCSGTGTMRRHPEIPWRLTACDALEELPALQRALLGEAARRVAPGGALLYATCSVLQAENEDVVHAFLSDEAGRAFRLAPVAEAPIFAHPGFEDACAWCAGLQSKDGTVQTVPSQARFDGHFCARFVRV